VTLSCVYLCFGLNLSEVMLSLLDFLVVSVSARSISLIGAIPLCFAIIRV